MGFAPRHRPGGAQYDGVCAAQGGLEALLDEALACACNRRDRYQAPDGWLRRQSRATVALIGFEQDTRMRQGRAGALPADSRSRSMLRSSSVRVTWYFLRRWLIHGSCPCQWFSWHSDKSILCGSPIQIMLDGLLASPHTAPSPESPFRRGENTRLKKPKWAAQAGRARWGGSQAASARRSTNGASSAGQGEVRAARVQDAGQRDDQDGVLRPVALHEHIQACG